MVMQTKIFKEQIRFIENDSYQLNLLIENLVHSKQRKVNGLLMYLAHVFCHKIIKKISLYNKYLMKAVN